MIRSEEEEEEAGSGKGGGQRGGMEGIELNGEIWQLGQQYQAVCPREQ